MKLSDAAAVVPTAIPIFSLSVMKVKQKELNGFAVLLSVYKHVDCRAVD